MKTKLEIMVGYLAGRQGEDADRSGGSSRTRRARRAAGWRRFGAVAGVPRPGPAGGTGHRRDSPGPIVGGAETHHSSPEPRPSGRTRTPGVQEATVPVPSGRLGRRDGAPRGGARRGGPRTTGSAASKRPWTDARPDGGTASSILRRPSRNMRHCRQSRPRARKSRSPGKSSRPQRWTGRRALLQPDREKARRSSSNGSGKAGRART